MSRGRVGAAFGLIASIVSLGTYSAGRSPSPAADEPPPAEASPTPSPSTVEPAETPTASVSPSDTGSIPKVTATVVSPKPTLSKPAVAVPSSANPTPTPIPSPSVAAPSPAGVSKAAQIVAYVRAQVGLPYVYGGVGPASFDCSGLVQTAFARVGVALPRTSQAQSTQGVRVSLDDLQPGDIVFWGVPGSAYHDAVYVGGGLYVAAENPGAGVVLRSMSYYRPDFARRVL